MTRTADHPSQGATRRTAAWAAASALTGLTLLGALGSAHAAGVPGQGTWETTLQGRDLDGNAANGFEAFYDTVLNITWLADANYAQTSGFDVDGPMNWNAAMNWVTSLNVFGTTGWRLPTMVDVGDNGCTEFSSAGGANTDCGYNVDTSLSEMAHLYYATLGNKGVYAPGTGSGGQSGWGLSNTGPFQNVPSYEYWSGVEYAPSSVYYAWSFDTNYGYQYYDPKGFEFLAWAVHPGDIAAPVPEPQTIALALAGLAVAGVAARGRHRRCL